MDIWILGLVAGSIAIFGLWIVAADDLLTQAADSDCPRRKRLESLR